MRFSHSAAVAFMISISFFKTQNFSWRAKKKSVQGVTLPYKVGPEPIVTNGIMGSLQMALYMSNWSYNPYQWSSHPTYGW